MALDTLSIVIPTYGREKVLIETVACLLAQAQHTRGFVELIVVDQTARHEAEPQSQLEKWQREKAIVWCRRPVPHLTQAMNFGLYKAQGDIVLFVDDDIIPGDALLEQHLAVYRREPRIWAVAGQVLQPGETSEYLPFVSRGGNLRRDLDFPFRSTASAYVENVMAGNLSVVKNQALALGGFDESFIPPVASRFETEFAKRIAEKGGRIRFEPRAGISHLRAEKGGTRSFGSHLSSMSPCFGVGDYYFALRRGKGWERWWYICRRPFREIRTKFHCRHPWWIPVKLVGELRAIRLALKLVNEEPRLINTASFDDADLHQYDI